MSSNWDNAWKFTRSERRGIIVLVVLAVISGLYCYFVPEWYSNKQIKKFEEELSQYLASVDIDRNQIDTIDTLTQTNTLVLVDSNKIKQVEEVSKKTSSVVISTIDVNSVDAKTLIQIGVSQESAFRIVKFRNKLGGFYALNQVEDVFGLTPEEYKLIKSKQSSNSFSVSKISFNTAAVEQLSNHPYISQKLANQIVSYRTKFKPFESSEDVKNLYLVDDELFEKLIHYVSYQ